jgi:hypothetical protein
VRFGTKDGGSVTLRHEEFLRRFLLHVLPPGFVKIRHYGLLAGRNVKDKLPQARRALGQVASEPEPVGAVRDWRDILRSLTQLLQFEAVLEGWICEKSRKQRVSWRSGFEM